MSTHVGRRVFTQINRPDPQLVARFRGIPSSNIGDSMERLYCMNASIYPLNKVPLLGVAFTVKAPAGDNMVFHRALDLAQPGDVLVVDGQGCMERSLAGEIMLAYAWRRGLAGVVVDGCLRDLDAISRMPIAAYCKGITPQGPYKHGPGEINVPVCCGGLVVSPGDILAGDEDGIVVIRPEDAEEVLAASLKKVAVEERSITAYQNDAINYQAHTDTYEKQLADMGYVYL